MKKEVDQSVKRKRGASDVDFLLDGWIMPRNLWKSNRVERKE